MVGTSVASKGGRVASETNYTTPNDEQWNAIRSTGDHVLVAASAGTGKTYTIIAKILYLLGVPIRGETCPAPIGIDQLAAVTFTNKAAAELKTKLGDALRTAGRRRDAYRIDAARIGTIHSFCSGVLREFALRTKRRPTSQLVDEAESILMRAQAVRDALLDTLEEKSIPALADVVGRYGVDKVEKSVASLLDQGGHLDELLAHIRDHAEREQSVLELAARARQRIERRLEEDGLVDFDRIVTWTRDLIRDDPTVRRTLQRRVRALFIDEFQDVDRVQREIAYLLAEPEANRGDTTRLVLVGDPKQSIYRFRHADVTVWREVERDFTERGWENARVVPLISNRRSVAPILAMVDHLIGRKLDDPIDPAIGVQDFEIQYAPMHAVREIPPVAERVADRSVEIVTSPAKSDGKGYLAEDVRAIEAEALGERVIELREKGVAWRDMAVLLTGWGAADVYERALRARGVPTYTLRDEGFYSRLEVTDVIVALDTIRQPLNDRRLFGFLRSPFVGLADESLLAIARAIPLPTWPSLRDARLDDERERQLLSRGIALLDRLSRLRDRVSTAALIETLLNESGYLAHLALLGADGQQRIANLRKLVRIARGMAESGVAAFLDMIARSREVEAREGEARLFGENEDVVTITSVHSAKGLEWKVVFWCDMVRTPRHVTGEVLIGRKCILLKQLEDELDDGSHDQLDKAIHDEERAETKRLWYVAATRAKDLLVLSGVPLVSNRDQGSPASEVRLRFGDALAGNAVEYNAADGTGYTATVRQAPVPANLEVEGDHAVVPLESVGVLAVAQPLVKVAAGRARHSATELLTISRCARRHYLRYTIGLREPTLQRRGDGERSAVRRGLVVHDVLENYDDDVALGVLVEAAIGRWDPDAPPPERTAGASYRRRIAQNVEAVLGSEAYRAVFDHPDARRELPFSYVRGAGGRLEGTIDLIAPGEDGYSIVDVKTSEVDPDAAVAKAALYAPQRAVYSRAVEDIAEKETRSFGFQFAGDGAFVGGVRNDDGRDRDEHLLERLVQITRRGSRELTAFPTECEFCGYREAGWCAGVDVDATSRIGDDALEIINSTSTQEMRR